MKNLDNIGFTSKNISIERVTEADAFKLLEIYAPYVSDTAVSFEYEVPSVEEFQNRIKDITSRYPYYKAVEKGDIIGYAYANTFKGRPAYDWSVETTIYIRSDRKRSGVGRALYAKLEEALKGMGVLTVCACIASPIGEDRYLTDDSRRFHEAMGYSLVGCFHNSGYKFDHWYDMIWMEKEISGHPEHVPEVKFGKW